MSKTRSLHHIVFATKRREMTITEEYKKELYAYIMGIVKNKKCHLIRINGIPNHIHMLIDINPSVAIADLVKDIKLSTNQWLRKSPHFCAFERWGEGYYAVSLGIDSMESCRQYIINQENHHLGHNLMDEMEDMAKQNELMWHRDDWE